MIETLLSDSELQHQFATKFPTPNHPTSQPPTCAVGRPFILVTPLLVNRCGDPTGESSFFSCRQYTVASA